MVFILRWKITGRGFGNVELVLWPASIMLMGLEGIRSIPEIIIVYVIVLAANVIQYAILGLLTWPVVRFILRRTHSQP